MSLLFFSPCALVEGVESLFERLNAAGRLMRMDAHGHTLAIQIRVSDKAAFLDAVEAFSKAHPHIEVPWELTGSAKAPLHLLTLRNKEARDRFAYDVVRSLAEKFEIPYTHR